MKTNRSGESGSVIIWIFIAVILFAALSFTVSNITRTGSPGQMDELANMRATDIMQFAGAVQRGIRFMSINGVAESEICFHADNWGHNNYEYNPQCTFNRNRVFHPEGGSIAFQEAPPDWLEVSLPQPANDAGTWVFSARFEVEDVGTDGGGGDTVAANADLVMAIAPIKIQICESVNSLLGYNPAPPTVAASTYDDLATNEFVGTFADTTERIGALGRERCVRDPAGYNVYYKVILAR